MRTGWAVKAIYFLTPVSIPYALNSSNIFYSTFLFYIDSLLYIYVPISLIFLLVFSFWLIESIPSGTLAPSMAAGAVYVLYLILNFIFNITIKANFSKVVLITNKNPAIKNNHFCKYKLNKYQNKKKLSSKSL